LTSDRMSVVEAKEKRPRGAGLAILRRWLLSRSARAGDRHFGRPTGRDQPRGGLHKEMSDGHHEGGEVTNIFFNVSH
jgi:hypothetical protein